MNYQDIICGDTKPNLNKLTRNIEEWASDRGLDVSDPSKQIIKLIEEAGETCNAYLKNRPDEIVDGIGDMYVVLTILCLQLDIDVRNCVDIAWHEIKDRRGQMVNNVFIKEGDL